MSPQSLDVCAYTREGDDPLTDRERQVLRLAGDGKSSADIAGLVHLSEGTVRNYLSEAIAKLGAANRIEAARLARHKGSRKFQVRGDFLLGSEENRALDRTGVCYPTAPAAERISSAISLGCDNNDK